MTEQKKVTEFEEHGDLAPSLSDEKNHIVQMGPAPPGMSNPVG